MTAEAPTLVYQDIQDLAIGDELEVLTGEGELSGLRRLTVVNPTSGEVIDRSLNQYGLGNDTHYLRGTQMPEDEDVLRFPLYKIVMGMIVKGGRLFWGVPTIHGEGHKWDTTQFAITGLRRNGQTVF